MNQEILEEQKCGLETGSGFDWTKFQLKVYVESSPEKIFQSWTTPVGLNSFFTRQAKIFNLEDIERKSTESAQSGDKYEWMVVPQAGLEGGKFIEIKKNKLIKFTFSGDTTPVTISINELGPKDCKVQLTMENLPDTERGHIDWHLSCRTGWSKFLINLKTVLESELDIRELSPGRDKEDIVN